LGGPVKHEIGDGTRFAELAYVWDPNTIWTLLVRCTYPDYNAFISATEIVNSAETVHNQLKLLGGPAKSSRLLRGNSLSCGSHSWTRLVRHFQI
ncbi:unnamed protein product, partial [Pocillopora meandrina]